MSTTLSRWRGRLATRRSLLRSAQQRLAQRRGEHATAQVIIEAHQLVDKREDQVAYAERVVARHRELDEIIDFDGAPVPRGLALALTDARKHGWKGTVQSCDRREGIAERFGKSSQAALYRLFLKGAGNPANRPGESSHERCSDGSPSLARLGPAYSKPCGAKLAWWQTGIDASASVQLTDTLNRLGYEAARPYSSPREAHHVNFCVDPTARLHAKGLS